MPEGLVRAGGELVMHNELAHQLLHQVPIGIGVWDAANAVAPNDSSGNTNLPANALLSNTAPAELYASGPGSLSPVAQTISVAGGSQPHENRQPFLVLNFCVALQGIFPSPT